MIKFDNIRLQRGSKVLLEHANAVLYPGQKIALIGANGSGKSSAFQLLLSELHADDGTLSVPQGWRIGHMAQEVASTKRLALDFVVDGDSVLREIEENIALAEQNHKVDQLAVLLERMDDIDGYNANVRAEQLLQGLGFSHADTQQPVNSFSGGWRIRLNLAQALMSASDLLLLDEPTNHLDLDAELWLEQWLQRYEGNLLLISHDRDFIDSVCEGIIHIERKKLNTYKGNYSAFERQRAERLAQQQASFEKQQARKKEIHSFVNRFRAKATKAKQAQSRLKELERMEDIAPAHVDSPFDFSFPPPNKISDPLLNISKGQLGYNEVGILNTVSLSIHPGSRIGFLGANGAGKSTLIKVLAQELPLMAGELTQGENLELGYFSQHQLEALDLAASPALHLQRLRPAAREQEIRNFLGGFDFRGEMALDCIENFSGGEKARLALAIIVWQRPNLLLLDEPTNHLDLEMCHALTVALQAYEGAVIIVSHDRHLLRNTVDQFYLVANGKVCEFDGDLSDYSQWLMQQKRLDSKASKTKSNDLIVTGGELATANSTTKKDQRQRSAELRKKMSPLNNAIKSCEKNLEQLERVLQEQEVQLADSSLYEQGRKKELQDLLFMQAENAKQKAQEEERWLALNDELELLKGESMLFGK
jgi:ATP-binding cassette subfamily F protein 3